METPAITATGLRVNRGHREVLHGLNFSVDRGSVTGLLGPNGSGKTTLMRSIVGVQVIDAGSLQVLGHPAGAPPLRHRIGYATQNPAVYNDLTTLENLRYFATILKAPRSDVDRVLTEVALSDCAHTLVAALSGGQRHRVSLAIALLGSKRRCGSWSSEVCGGLRPMTTLSNVSNDYKLVTLAPSVTPASAGASL